jgi:transcriptional regulator with XRE-family HTH domain
MESKQMKGPDIIQFTNRIGLNYRQLAERLGKSTGFIGQMAAGRSSVSYDTMLALVELGMNAEELFGVELGKVFRKRCANESAQGVESVDEQKAGEIVLMGLRRILRGTEKGGGK